MRGPRHLVISPFHAAVPGRYIPPRRKLCRRRALTHAARQTTSLPSRPWAATTRVEPKVMMMPMGARMA